MRETLPGVQAQTMQGDNLAILLASFFEPGIDDEELDDSGTWKQGAIDAADQVLDAIHAHYVAILSDPPQVSADDGAVANEIRRLAMAEIDAANSVIELPTLTEAARREAKSWRSCAMAFSRLADRISTRAPENSDEK